MRILIAIGVTRQQETGAAGVVLNHARELEKLGHSVECWFLEDVLTKPAKPKRFEALMFAAGAARRIWKQKNKYDVVNLHAPWGCVYGSWRSLTHRSDAPPYVLTMQGLEERYVLAMRREDRKGRALNFGWKNRIWHRVYHQTMYARSIRTANFGVVANREAWICAELKYNRANGTFWYVPNGVEEHFLVPRQYPEKQEMRLLYVGSWLDRKGIYYLAEAFGSLARTNPSISLTVAGCLATPDVVKGYFEAECRSRLSVVPFVKRVDMPKLYADHDVFVFPSLMEGMPLTLLEAMASGMPAITTCTSGMADVIEDGYNGFLVSPADAPALAESIRQLVGSAELRKRIGQNAQETTRRYTWENISQRVERVLLMAAQSGSRS
jgi:glycosyltransferase involved in cell wall biosynthesis